MSASKRKGTAAETAVVRYLRENGFPYAERRALAGVADLGDVTGIPQLVVEVKAHRSYAIPAWLRELEAEIANAKADNGVLVVKPNGVGAANVADWWAVMPMHSAVVLLRDAGFGGAS